jgi:hypothetical protein
VSQTVISGQTATFSVAVAGTTPLSYQWFKGGVALNGATGISYTTPVTAGGDNGSVFSVTVTNAAGSCGQRVGSINGERAAGDRDVTDAGGGLNEAPIAALIHRILVAYTTSTSLKIQSLLIARHDHLVVGLAKKHGAKLMPQTPIYPLFKQYSSFANWDDRKEKITLGDVMTMTAGNACDDNNDDSPGNEDRMQSDEKQRDWYKYSLDLPMLKLRRPESCGGSGCRSDASLASRVIRRNTGSAAAVRALLSEPDARCAGVYGRMSLPSPT